MSNIIMLSIVVAVISYFIGSINGAVVISKLVKHDDVRKYGSKNAGMTNMLRVYGKSAAIQTIFVDFTKGMLCVFIARYIFSGIQVPFDAGYIAGIFTIIGHIFPIYFRFKGGKGILASLGIITVVNPPVFLFMLLTLIPLCFVTKIVSFSSIVGAILYPILTCILDMYLNKPFIMDTVFSTIIAVLIVYMHKENIKRLLNGTEKKLGQSKKKQ